MIRAICGGIKSKIKYLLLPQVVLVLINMVKPVIQCVVLKSDFDWAVLNPFAWNIWFLPVLFICSLFYMLLTCFCGMCRIKNKVFV